MILFISFGILFYIEGFFLLLIVILSSFKLFFILVLM